MEVDVDQILIDLGKDDGLPRRSLELAIAHQDAVTEPFLAALEDFLDDPEPVSRDSIAVFFILHLLAQFREPRACPLLLRVLSRDEELVERVLGDAITATLSRLVVSVYDGDPQPLYDVIRNPRVEEYVRAALFEAMAYLVRIEKVDADEFRKFLLSCYADMEPQGINYAWIGWLDAISLAGFKDMKNLVRQAYASGKANPTDIGFSGFEADLTMSMRRGGFDGLAAKHHVGYFDDTIQEFEKWHSYTKTDVDRAVGSDLGYDPDADSFLDAPAPAAFLVRPATNPNRNVGRNDPCPCGSGKKYKKCCLQ